MYQYIHMTFFIFKLTNLHSQMNLKFREITGIWSRHESIKVSVNFFPLMPFESWTWFEAIKARAENMSFLVIALHALFKGDAKMKPSLSIRCFDPRKNCELTLLHVKQNLLFWLISASVGWFVMNILLTVQITMRLSLMHELKMSEQLYSFKSHLKVNLNVF